jgi:DNA-3-methyladenine glycosylase I
MTPSTVRGQDGKRRCAWCASDPLYMQYHDREWGRPVRDERAIFEKICLEGFQAGLSWLTILKKREAFREAFKGFEPEVVARFGSRDITRLMNNAAIVRNRMKIESTINNARATLRLAESGQSLAALVWSAQPAKKKSPPRSLTQVPALTPESAALSKTLLKHGFTFVGPTTLYAAMQSLGVVNDHVASCHRARP